MHSQFYTNATRNATRKLYGDDTIFHNLSQQNHICWLFVFLPSPVILWFYHLNISRQINYSMHISFVESNFIRQIPLKFDFDFYLLNCN